MMREEREARYRQVLAWREEGVSFAEIGYRLGVSDARAQGLYRQAQRWQQQGMRATVSGEAPLTAATPLHALALHPHARVGLERAGVRTVGVLLTLSDEALLGIRGIGRATVQRLRAELAACYHAEGQEAEP